MPPTLPLPTTRQAALLAVAAVALLGVAVGAGLAPSAAADAPSEEGATAAAAPEDPATFLIDDLEVPEKVKRDGTATVTFDISNFGDRAGFNSYSIFVDGEIVFQKKINLEAGETKRIEWELDPVAYNLDVGRHGLRVETANDTEPGAGSAVLFSVKRNTSGPTRDAYAQFVDVNRTNIQQGDTFAVETELENLGTESPAEANLTLDVPPGFEVVEYRTEGQVFRTERTVRFLENETPGPPAPGETRRVTFVVKVKRSAEPGDARVLNLTGSIVGDRDDRTTVSIDEAVERIDVNIKPVLAVSTEIVPDPDRTVGDDGNVSIDVQIQNQGNVPADTASVGLDLPGGFELVDVEAPGGTWLASGDVFFGGDGGSPLEPGEFRTVTFVVNVDDSVPPGSYTVRARGGLDGGTGAVGVDRTTIDLGGTSDIARFDVDNDGEITAGEVVNAVGAYNSGRPVDGQVVTARDVIRVVAMYNDDDSV